MKPSPTFALFELIFASLLWGFGFIATVWGLKEVSPLTLTFDRFLLAVIVAGAVVPLSKAWRKDLSWDQLRLAFLPGVFLALTLILQTWGLTYTTATKSGFVTTLYVLLVPALDRAILKRRLHPLHPLFVLIAMVGTGLICQFQAGNWNIGDLLTLFCAVAASFQIFWFGMIADRIGSAFVFNFWQSVWACVLIGPLTLLETGPLLPTSSQSWVGLLMLTFGSTLIAFSLQVHAQQRLSPSVASLIYLLESPFATLFAITLLGETLSSSQWLGAGLILIAVALPSWLATRKSGGKSTAKVRVTNGESAPETGR